MKFVIVDKMGIGIASFDSMTEAARFQYNEKIYLNSDIVNAEI